MSANEQVESDPLSAATPANSKTLEFISSMSVVPRAQELYYKRVFGRIDKDGDGRIMPPEVKRFLQSCSCVDEDDTCARSVVGPVALRRGGKLSNSTRRQRTTLLSLQQSIGFHADHHNAHRWCSELKSSPEAS